MRVAGLRRCTAAAVTGTLIGALSVLGTAEQGAPLQLGAPDAQATDVVARHEDGRTFVTWREAEAVATGGEATVQQVNQARREASKRRLVYRVYRSDQPIGSVASLRPVAEIPAFSAWNTDVYGGAARPGNPVRRYVIQRGGEPLANGAGLFVRRADGTGVSYYAVTRSIDGQENQTLSDSNALTVGVEESQGLAVPVLQRTETPGAFQFVKKPTLHYYVRWESPLGGSDTATPYDYLVAVPPGVSSHPPAGLHLHAWGGSLTVGYGWWFNAEKGALLLSTNQRPYDWWTGYHELLFTESPPKSPVDWQRGVVRPYTQARLLSFLDWAASEYDIDLDRTFVAGVSMGGSGSIMLGVRHPQRFAWIMSWVGVHRPRLSPSFMTSYVRMYGRPEWNVKFEDGTPVWDYFDDVWYLRQHPEAETPFITFSNGKNDSGIGWPQAVDFLRALQETKRPHLFVWGRAGHGQRAIMPVDGGSRVMPLDLRVTRSLPAFTNCSLDDDPGGGVPADGAPSGQVNAYLGWDTDDIVDERDVWEMTVRLTRQAPQASCTVDVTPRRCQHFRARPGERFTWSSSEGGRAAQSGTVVADQWGLVTLPAVSVGKGGTRLRIARAESEG
jgi:pimeloyl-ACP methyl ester carboxylesterase